MSNKPKTKNDIAWEKLFDKYDIKEKIDREGFYKISSTQINEFREARLMTKFDHRNSLPQLFEQEKLSILPITRGDYIIGQFDVYHNFEKPSRQIHKFSFPSYISSINHDSITSEANAINAAYISGIIADFAEDEKLLPTISGRMSSEDFSFKVRNVINNQLISICVSNSQIEIDGGYEGLNSFIIIEAKNSISDDFLIRQLYYPYRLWKNRLQKPVRPVFLTYSNGIFSFYEYAFEDLYEYNSLSLVKQKNYSIEPDAITLDDIVAIYKKVKIIPEPNNIPFPQANSFERIINLCEILYENTTLSRDEITYRYDFNSRQTNYYTDAGRYLGLIYKSREKGTIQYYLTQKGINLFSNSIKIRNLRFVEFILEHKPFYLTFKLYLERGKMPSKEEIVKIMKESNLYRIEAEKTFHRRASTITSWINWIIELTMR